MLAITTTAVIARTDSRAFEDNGAYEWIFFLSTKSGAHRQQRVGRDKKFFFFFDHRQWVSLGTRQEG
jgi:hypothetical protein